MNCKGVHRVIHFGPSKSIEGYVQESGRAGRDGKPSTALLLYQSLMLLHVDRDMKDYVHGKYKCRRQFIMKTFEECDVQVDEEQVCCDLCNKDCNLTIASESKQETDIIMTREVRREEKQLLKEKLVSFRKDVVVKLISKAPNAKLPVVSLPELLIGFSNIQIKQVLDNADKIFCFSDVKKFVEVWKDSHAHSILNILSEVFNDTENGDLAVCEFQESELDEDEWYDQVFCDEELNAIDWEQMSHSSLFPEDVSCLENTLDADTSALELSSDYVGGLINQVSLEYFKTEYNLKYRIQGCK